MTLLTRAVGSSVVLFLTPAEHLPTPWTVQGDIVVVGMEIVVAPSTCALALERVVPADYAVAVIDLVAAEPCADGASLRDDGHSSLLTFAAEPARWIDGGATMTNLEVEMRRQVGIRDADGAELLPLGDGLVERDVGAGE